MVELLVLLLSLLLLLLLPSSWTQAPLDI